jgi:hypothetical protein
MTSILNQTHKEFYKAAYRDVRLVHHLLALRNLKKQPIPPYLMLERNPCAWKAFESYMARLRSEKMTS